MLSRALKWIRETNLYFSLFKKGGVKLRVEGACKMTGNCCRNLLLVDMGKPVRTLKQFKELVEKEPWHEMFIPHEKSYNDGMLRFTCTNLTEDHKCAIHDTRPDMCRRYPDLRMLKHGGELLPGCGYRIVPDKSFDEVLDEELVELPRRS